MNTCIGKKYMFQILDQKTDDVLEGIVYIIEADKLFHLKCPCGCGEVITGQLFPLDHPRWEYIAPDSLYPSINRKYGFKSHFTITDGVTH